jgi:hypothetical protein
MIAASPSHPIAYLWEPFSPLARPGIRDVPFDAWFAYVCERNQDRYEPGLRDMLAYRYRYAAELRAIRSPKDAGRLVRDAGRFRRFRTQGARPLLKDPIAVFSSEWIADRLGAEVIVLIRHPAAFVNSVVRRELRHPFRDFVDQPLLMDGLLAPFEDDVRRFAEQEQPLIDQGILLWNLIHHAIAEFRTNRPDWLFLRLEDVAQDPLARFGAMFDHLGLPFEDEVRATILEHSDASNPDQVADMASTKRDSRAAVQAWRRSLSSDDLGRIRGGVEPIAATFYGDEDW